MNIILRRGNGERALVPLYRPWGLLDEIEALAREAWDAWKPFTLDHGLVPHTDLYEEKDQLVMKTELPGIDKKDLDISLEGDILTIKAEKKDEIKEEATGHTRERYYGRYFRSVTLPYPVKEDNISATFDNGVLELRLPKAEEVKTKKIDIKVQLPETRTNKRQRKHREQRKESIQTYLSQHPDATLKQIGNFLGVSRQRAHVLLKVLGLPTRRQRWSQFPTERQTKILRYIASGYTNEQIAATFRVPKSTIKSQVSAILAQLNAKGRAQAVTLASQQGLI